LLSLIGDDALLARMAHEALARARHFSPARMADAYLGAYRRLCAAPLPRAHSNTKEPACAS